MIRSEIVSKVGKVCRKKNWAKDWSFGGCYLHLEVSEFIESLRGKGDDPPEKEAADVLFTLCALIDHYNLDTDEILVQLNKQVGNTNDNS